MVVAFLGKMSVGGMEASWDRWADPGSESIGWEARANEAPGGGVTRDRGATNCLSALRVEGAAFKTQRVHALCDSVR